MDAGHDFEYRLRRTPPDDPVLLELMVRAYYPPLYRLALTLLDERDAAAAARSALITAAGRLDQLPVGADVRAWIARIGWETCQRVRQRRRLRDVLTRWFPRTADREAPDRPGETAQFPPASLPRPLRGAFGLHAGFGLSIPETARLLGLPAQTVSTHLDAAGDALPGEVADLFSAFPPPDPDSVLTDLRTTWRRPRSWEASSRSLGSLLRAGLTLGLVLTLGWLATRLAPFPGDFNALTPSPAPTVVRLSRPEPFRVDGRAMAFLEQEGAGLEFTPRLPVNLYPGWRFWEGSVDRASQRVSMRFRRASPSGEGEDTLTIVQRAVNPESDAVFAPMYAEFPPDAALDVVEVGSNRALYIEGAPGPNGWDPDAPMWRIRWQEEGTFFELAHTGSLVGRSILTRIGRRLMTLEELRRRVYVPVLDMDPQVEGLALEDYLGGIAGPVAVQNGYAYLALGGTLTVLDVRAPESVRRIGLLPTAHRIAAIAIAGEHAYLAARAGGLLVVDLSDPASPRLVGRFQPGEGYPSISIQDVVVRDRYAYLAWRDERFYDTDSQARGGLRVVDLSDPAAPMEVAAYAAPHATHLALSGESLYLAGGICWPERCEGEVHALDISAPNAPRPRAVHETAFPAGIAADETRLYLTSNSCDWDDPLAESEQPTCEGALHVLDRSTFRPVYRESLPHAAGPVAVSRGLAYFISGENLAVRDAAGGAEDDNPPYYFRAQHLAVSGEWVYLSGLEAGLRIIRHNQSLRNLGEYRPTPQAQAVLASNGSLFVADAARGWMQIEPGTPPAFGSPFPISEGVSQAIDTATGGDRAYLASLTCDFKQECTLQLAVVGLGGSESWMPEAVTEIDTTALGRSGPLRLSVAASGVHVYLSDGHGLWTFDVSDPLRIREAGFQEVPALFPRDLAVIDDTLFLLGNGLHRMSIRDPGQPALLPGEPRYYQDRFRDRDRAMGMVDAGERIYLAGQLGLWALDPGSPERIEQVGSYSAHADLLAIEVAGGRLILGTDQGVQILDLSNPRFPRKIASYGPLAGVRDLAMIGDVMYVVDRLNGLAVLRLEAEAGE